MSISGMPGPPLGPTYRMTTTHPGWMSLAAIAATAEASSSKTRAGTAVDEHLREHRGFLHHRPVGSQVAEQDGETARGAVGPGQGPDHLVVAGTQRLVLGRELAARDGRHAAVDEARLRQPVKHRHDPTGPMEVLHVPRAGRRQLDQVRRLRRHLVEGSQGKLQPHFARDGDEMKHRVGGATQGRVQHQGVAQTGGGQEAAGAPPLADHLDCLGAGAPGQGQPRGERRGDGGVTGQGQSQALGQAAHGVGGEEAGARAARGTGGLFEFAEFVRAHLAAEEGAHPLEHVLVLDPPAPVVAGQHRPSRDHHRGQVEAGRGHHHAGHHLVAVGDQHQSVEGVSLGHDLHRVGDDLAADQRVVHALVVHGQAVADADDVELKRQAAALVDPVLDLLGDAAQVHVPRHQLVEGIGDADEGRPASARPTPSARSSERWGARAGPRVSWSLRIGAGRHSSRGHEHCQR